MPRWDCVAILGVGLIGGSIGLALKRRNLAGTVIGVDRRESVLDAAQQLGAVDRATSDLRQAVHGAEIVVVAAPVAAIVPLVRRAARYSRPGCVLTDVGSTKLEIVSALVDLPRESPFVGGHPMAGSEKSGACEADPEMFVGRPVVLTPGASTTKPALATIGALWTELGAQVVRMPAEKHDRLVAYASHLPHVTAACLSAVLPIAAARLAAGGLRDTTRIAASDPELWKQILLSNRGSVLEALGALETQLAELRHALTDNDAAALKRILQKAQRQRKALDS